MSTAYKGLNEAQQAQLKAYKDQQRASLNLASAEKSESLETEKLKIKKQQLTKASKQAAKEELGLVSAYDELVAKMNAAGKIVQNLNAKKLQGEKLSAKEIQSLKKSTAEFSKYNKAVLGADASIKRFQRNVGNYPKGLNAAASAARNLASAMGLVGGAFLIVRVVGNALKRIREFDKSMQNLAGVLQVSRKELAPIESEIISVAGASIKTSREVADLANSLATLGKKGQDLINLIEPANDLAIALETTSDEAAEFLVGTLNAFEQPSIKAREFASTIAAIRTSTTLDFQKMKDSFQYLTPIANILNKDLAYSGAVIGVLNGSTIKAEAGSRLLGTALQKLAKEGNTLDGALKELNDAINNGVEEYDLLAIATKLFGKQAAKVGIVLAKNVDILEENAESIRKNQTALDDLIEKQLESLDAKIKILDSTWEKLILTIEKGDGKASSFFKGVINFTEGALRGLTSLIQTQEEYNASLSSDITKKKYKEELKFYNDLGDSAERVALERADRSRDEVDAINKEIESLKNKNKELEGASSFSGEFLFESRESQLTKNQEKLDQLAAKLGVYNGVLKASEDYLEGVTDQTNKNTESTKENEEAKVRSVAYLRDLIKAENERIINLDLENEEQKKLIPSIQKTIKAYQSEIDAILGTNKARKSLNIKREKIIPIEFKTAEESKKEFQDYAKKVMEVLEDNFGIEAGQIDPIKLPPLDSAEFKAGLTELQKLTNEFITDLSLASIDNSPLSSLATFFDGTFEDLILGADSVAEEFAITFNAIGEVAKQTFSLISELGQQNFESQLDRLSKEKEADLQFAGEGTAAREQIEEQYEERRIAIQTKQAKAQKDQAIFNAGVTTAQATLAAYASQLIPGDPTSIIRAKVAAAIAASFGLLQIGFISAQELPQFKDGVINFKGGDAVVGDGGISEVIRTPDGSLFKTPSTDTIVNLPKGSDVFSSEDEFFKDLRKLTDMNNIMFDSNLFQIPDLAPSINIENNGASAKDIDRVMGKYFSQISTNNISFDKNGIKTWMSKGNSKNILHNNRTSFKGFSV